MRTMHKASTQAGQTICHAMLTISCVALALAIFFPVYELLELYRGEVRVHKFVPKVTRRVEPTTEEAAEPEPTTEEAPEPEPATGEAAESAETSETDTSEPAGSPEPAPEPG